MKSGAILLACSLGLLAPATASAEQSTETTGFPVAGPAFSGDHLVWAEAAGDGGARVLASRPSAPPEILHRVPNPDRAFHFQLVSLSASAARIASALTPWREPRFSGDEEVDPGAVGRGQLFSAPLPGALERIMLERCLSGVGFNGRPQPQDVDGEVLAYEDRDCGDQVSVRDFAAPGSPTRRVSTGTVAARAPRVAGRFVAFLEGDRATHIAENREDIVVYDRLAGAEAYRVRADRIPSKIESLDVQEDGKVAFSFVGELDSRRGFRLRYLGWASAAEPDLHRLPLAGEDRYDVKLVADMIVFFAGSTQGGRVGIGKIGIADLAGNARLLATGVDDHLPHDSYLSNSLDAFAFDGRRVAFAALGCSRAVLHVRLLTEPQWVGTRRSRCRLKFKRRPVLNHRLRLALDCAGFASEETCISTVKVTARPRAASSAGRGLVLAQGELTGERTASLRLSGRARRFLRHRRRVRVRVTAVIRDAVGRRERRAAIIVVRRRNR